MGHIGRYEREKSKERFAPLRGRKVIDASNDWYRAVDTTPQRHYTDALGEIANPLHHREGGEEEDGVRGAPLLLHRPATCQEFLPPP